MTHPPQTTPTPSSPQPAPGLPQPRAKRAAGTAILWTVGALGTVMILGIGASAVTAALGSRVGVSSEGTHTVSAEGLTALELDISSAEFALNYAEVPEATLAITGANAERWRLSRDGGQLEVASPRGMGGSCWFGFCPPDRATHTVATLTLPRAFADRPVDLDAEVGVGSLTADGSFGAITLDVGAGDARLSGTANDLDITVGVGHVSAEFGGVQTAAFDVSMGEIDARLRGDAPSEVSAEVGVGSLTLELPDIEYLVQTETSLGDVRNGLRTAPDARSRITAEVSLGELVLRPGR